MKIRGKEIIKRMISFVLCFSMVLLSAVPAGAQSFSPALDTESETGISDTDTYGKTTTGSSIKGGGIKSPATTGSGIISLLSGVTTGTGVGYVFDGEGTAESPYIISAEEDLRGMADEINADSEKYFQKYFKIEEGSDIKLTEEWVPIGTEENPFKGYFDGNNRTIENIIIGDSTSASAINYQGLFGYSEGTLENITATGTIISAADYVGGIAGYSKGVIRNCTFGLNDESYVEGRDYVGGVAGDSTSLTNGSSSSSNILKNNAGIEGINHVGGIFGRISANVTSRSYIKLENAGTIQGNTNVGGILGSGSSGIIFGTSVITFNEGKITAASSNAGGIIGSAASVTFNTTSNITNEGEIGSLSNAGGIIGASSGTFTVQNSAAVTNKGNVETEENNAGGIIGLAETVTLNTSSIVTNEGDVETILNNAGGIIGSAKIINVQGKAKAENKGYVETGGNNAGGIIGFCNENINATTGFLINNAVITASGSNAGGIAGRIEVAAEKKSVISMASVTGGSILSASNSGGIAGSASGDLSITDSCNRVNISSDDNVNGAIIADVSSGTSISIKNSFSFITVEGAIKEIPLTRVTNAEIQNSYYLGNDFFDTTEDNAARKIDEFKYGKIAYLIDRDDKGNQKSIWGQKLGVDDTPEHHDAENMHPVVYKNEIKSNDTIPDISVAFDIPDGSPYKSYGNLVYLNRDSEVELSVSGLKEENEILLFLPLEFVSFDDGKDKYVLTAKETDVLLTYSIGINILPDTSWYDISKESFELNTQAQLLGLAELVNNGTDDFIGKTIIIVEDINLLPGIWKSIGTGEHPFRGIFEAKEKSSEGSQEYAVINNFNFTVADSIFGLFGNVENATIRNLTVNGSSKGEENIAGIAANAKNSKFISCINNVNVTGTAITGGIVGFSDGSIFENCVNHARIYTVGAAGNAGGIAAIAHGGIFDSCVNSGDVNSAGNAGGIVSEIRSASRLKNCRNDGIVEGSNATGGIAANIIGGSGAERTELINCYNSRTGTVKGTGTYVGGVAGNVGEFTYLRNCFNDGEIDSQATNAAGVAGNLTAGATVEGCYNSKTGVVKNTGNYTAGVFGRVGARTKLEEIYNAGTVTGDGNYTAGVFAYGSTNMQNNVKRCYNTGNVEGNGQYVAGICADLKGTKAYNSDSTSHLHQCYNLGNITGTGSNTKAAGILGANQFQMNVIGSYVVNSYNLGTVSASNPSNIGAISAINWQVNESSYYSEDSLPGEVEPVDSSNAAALSRDAFENGEAAYLFDVFSSSNRRVIWGQGDGYPVPKASQNNLIYKISLITSGPPEGFEGEKENINKIIYKGHETSKGSSIDVYSQKGKEINLNYIEKEGYLLNTVSAGDKRIKVQVNEGAKTIKIYLTEESDITVDVNFISKPEGLKPSYTVIYNVNEGQWTGGIKQMSQAVKGGYRAEEPSQPFNNSTQGVKKIFAGWYTDEECTVSYDFTAAVISDLTLYAGWEIVSQHDVIFDANGGSFGEDEIITFNVDDGEKAEIPTTDPVREGHEFRGWYSDEDCLYLYDLSKPVKLELKLYAGWAREGTCVVVFDGNGGIIQIESTTSSAITTAAAIAVEVNKGSTVSSLTAERADKGSSTFTFEGWYTQSGTKWNFSAPINTSMTLTARWTENFFQVPFPGGVYEIDSFEAFEEFARGTNESGYTYEGSTFKLKTDIELPADWVPIGYIASAGASSGSYGFRGIFDGGGHTITIDNYQKLPVFGCVGFDGVVTNVKVKGDTVYNIFVPVIMTLFGEASNIEVSGEFYKCSAGIVNEVFVGSLIKDCTIKSGSIISGEGAVGGILSLGRSGEGTVISKIEGCVVESGVTIMAADGQQYVQALGGIVGYSMGIVEGCSNGATLISKYKLASRNITGGIVGSVNSVGNANVINCVNTGDIISTGGYVGGIAGHMYAAYTLIGVESSYSTGNISVSGNVSYVGGIGGYISRVTNSYWYGEFIDVPEGTEKVGAITGYVDSSLRVENSYFAVKSSGTEEAEESISDLYEGNGSTKLTAEDFEIGRAAYLLDGGKLEEDEEEFETESTSFFLADNNDGHKNIWTHDFEKGYPILGEPSMYMITISSTGPGHIKIRDREDISFEGWGNTVYIESVPDEETEEDKYILNSILVTDSAGDTIPCSLEDLEFKMPEENVTVLAEFSIQEKAIITVQKTGCDNGATVSVGNAEIGEPYYAKLGDTVTVTVSILPHPEVEGAASAEYYLRNLTVKFEDGSTENIAGTRQFEAKDNAVVTADIGERVVFPEPEPEIKIEPQITGFPDGAVMTIGSAESGQAYVAGKDEIVAVNVSILPHPKVEGAISAEYFLKSLTVRFEDGSTLDITGSGQLTAADNAVVTANIGEKIVFPVPDEGGDDDGDDKGDGKGNGTGEGTGGGTNTEADGEQTGIPAPGTDSGIPADNSTDDKKDNESASVDTLQQSQNKEATSVEYKPEEQREEEEAPPELQDKEPEAPKEPEKPEEPQEPEEAEEVSAAPAENSQGSIIPPIAAAVSAIVLILIGIYRFIILKKKK